MKTKYTITILCILGALHLFSLIAYNGYITYTVRSDDTYFWMTRVNIYRKLEDNMLTRIWINTVDPDVASLNKHVTKKGY